METAEPKMATDSAIVVFFSSTNPSARASERAPDTRQTSVELPWGPATSQTRLHTAKPLGSEKVNSDVAHAPNSQMGPPTAQPGTGPMAPPSASRTRKALILISLYIPIFLVALDRTNIGPAIPAITNQFMSIVDIGWYGSAYMLTSCGFILFYGRIYTFLRTKSVILSSVLVFEAGSAGCGATNSSRVLIVGRAIAGLGSSGIFTGAILIIFKTVPLRRRPVFQGLFGACFGVASVTGPQLGGALTESPATRRWCFYINLPLGGITAVVILLLLQLDDTHACSDDWKTIGKKLDPIGTLVFLASITSLLLALEWGGTTYGWNDQRMIALLVVFAVLFCAFIAWQFLTRNTIATIPGRIVTQRSVAFGSLSQLCVGATMLTVSIYIPLWFQAIQGTSAVQSGINTIPLVLSVVVGSISCGVFVQRLGYYVPCMVIGSCLMAVGVGLLTTWHPKIGKNKKIGFQVFLGLGVGFTMQHPNIAIQVVLPAEDVPTGTALLSLSQTLGGAVFVAVGQNVFLDKFSRSLANIGAESLTGVSQSGATDLLRDIPAALRDCVVEAYNDSLTHGPLFAALIVACLAVPSALGMEWRSVKKEPGAGLK